MPRSLKKFVNLVSVAVIGLSLFATPLTARAATVNATQTAKLSFTFDDGLKSTITQAAPTLAKYGYTGTSYVTTGCVGMTSANNTCHANTDAIYMTWAQIKQLQNTYKWEIGSHTVSHPYLASSDAEDGQPNVLTPAQVTAELANSRTALAAQGITATDFATPYGDYTPPVLAQIAKYYATQRGFADTGYNNWPSSDYLLRVQQVQAGVSVATVKGYIDAAVANKQWLILVFHDIKTNASTNPDDYEYKTADLDAIAAYAKTKGITNANVNQGRVTSDINLFSNGSFNSGIASGWSTDVPTAVSKDSGTNGSYPDATNSAKLVATNRPAHLFSSQIAVDPSTTYSLRTFINMQKLTSGEASFYIDEYDGFGNWISGQYKGGERSVFVENVNFNYKPSSSRVAKIRYQVGVGANTGITAFVDNVQMFPLTTTSTPAPTNLLSNGTFDAGLAGWSTNSPTTISADALNNGSPANATNSVKLASTTVNRHLFSPTVAVVSGRTYSLNGYLNVKTIASGEVGFYIDEYDNAGNWISGQYKTGVRSVGAGNVAMSYSPTSSTVAKASLQVIVMGNSGTAAYFDDASWYAN